MGRMCDSGPAGIGMVQLILIALATPLLLIEDSIPIA
jgi:hypothetical protein